MAITLQRCSGDLDDPNPGVTQADGEDYSTFLAAKYPLPILTPILPIKVTVTFTDSFWGRWDDGKRARILRAARLFETVWGSQEFKDKVQSIPMLSWHINTTDEDALPTNIAGTDLYPKLVSNQSITLSLHLSVKGKGETADTANNTTNFRRWWADEATVYDLCNTLSHEYTHYDATGDSWDQGYRVRRECVSYGIGGLTENLAAACVRCDDDPTIPA